MALRKNLRAIPLIEPFADPPAQPSWVEREFPAYAAAGHAGAMSSQRVVHVGGHHIEITTTYSVTIDGEPATIHMFVDTDGRLWSHVCPYRTFASAGELIAYVVKHVPEALTGVAGAHSGHGGHAGGAA
jgi:hypothetical protein